jgi:hypothetical protein
MARIKTYQSLKESLLQKSPLDQYYSGTSGPRATSQAQPTMFPYRDPNGVVRYALVPGAQRSDDDESIAPLIAPGEGLDDDQHDAMQRFTATGKPMPLFRPALMGMYVAPQHFPQRFTDESIIPVVVRVSPQVIEVS